MKLKSRVLRTIYGKKREIICPYGIESKPLIERNTGNIYLKGYSDLLSRPSIEMNTIWIPIIKNSSRKKSNMSSGKISYIV